MAVPDAAQRQKLEDALLRKADDLLRQMRCGVESGTVDTVERNAETLTGLLKVREFPTQRATEFRDSLRLLRRNVFQHSVENLLCQAERLARANDDKARNEALTRAKEHFVKALGCGADDDYRQGVERRVQAVLMTNGGGVDQRTKDAAARRLEIVAAPCTAPGGVERRRVIRYGTPELTVVLDGTVYRTINWSIRGLLLATGDGTWRLGDRLRLEIGCEDHSAPGRQSARVVRIGEPPQTLAVEFPAISTVILEITRELKASGSPAEADR